MSKWRKRLALPLMAYGIAVLVYLFACCVQLGLDTSRRSAGSMPTVEIGFDDLLLDGLNYVPDTDDQLVSVHFDPYMVYEPGGAFYADTLVFDAEYHRPGGEMVVYYTTKPGQGFSERRKVWAQQDENGVWYFDLGGRQVYKLRLDPDTTELGIVWTIHALTLNPPRAAWRYFVPDARQGFLLLVAPGLGAALLYECVHAIQLRKKRENTQKD